MHTQASQREDGQRVERNGAPGAAGRTPRRRIVVVEDDAPLRDLLEDILRREGYAVFSASNALDAIGHIEEGGTDLIITDLYMPRMDGLELVTRLRKAGRTMPVIAITGALTRHSGAILRAARLLGAHITLEKPFPAGRLLEAVHLLLGFPPSPAKA
jgi:two-component system cell cycle response regulator CpdR